MNANCNSFSHTKKQKKKSAMDPEQYWFNIHSFHKFVRTDSLIFLVFIIGLFISNIDASLQAKLSTLV